MKTNIFQTTSRKTSMNVRKSCKLLNFTLIELLVVIAIIAILASMLLPALSKARDSSKKILCTSNMKQMYYCVGMYMNDYNSLIPVSDSWKPAIYPYITNRHVPTGTNYTVCCDIRTRNIKVYFCPSVFPWVLAMDQTLTGVGWNYTYMGYHLGDSNPQFAQQKYNNVRKPGITIMFGDTKDVNDQSKSFQNDYLYPTDTGTGNPLTTRHLNGLNMTFADGHVEWNPAVYYMGKPSLYKINK